MKNYIFLFTMFFLSLNLTATEPPQDTSQQKTELPTTPKLEVTTRDSSEVPDSICVTTKTGIVCVPTGDAKILIDLITEIAGENKGNWPKTILGWITLLVGIAFSVRGTIAITAAKRIYAFLKVFLRSTLNIVAFGAGAVSTGITFLLGRGEFDWTIFGILWPSLAFLSVYVYEAFFKKPEPEKTK